MPRTTQLPRLHRAMNDRDLIRVFISTVHAADRLPAIDADDWATEHATPAADDLETLGTDAYDLGLQVEYMGVLLLEEFTRRKGSWMTEELRAEARELIHEATAPIDLAPLQWQEYVNVFWAENGHDPVFLGGNVLTPAQLQLA